MKSATLKCNPIASTDIFSYLLTSCVQIYGNAKYYQFCAFVKNPTVAIQLNKISNFT